ncbi:MAG: phosphatidate cytidylyltransferase [Sarcina sp.]|nr:phosphatidate cytidylyltransferase [Sarcina sp.]
MRQRIISGLIIAAAIILLGFAGSYPLCIAVMLCSIIGYLELTAVLCPGPSSKKKRPAEKRGRGPDLIAVPGLLLTVVYYAGLMVIEWRYGLVNTPAMISASDFWTIILLAADFLLTMGVYVYTFPRRKSSSATGAVTAFFYVPVMLSFVCRTRNLAHGFFLYLLIFVCSSVSDVCALAVGMAIGRHKLAPVLSPKKTIEGAIGGVAGSAAVSCLIAFLLMKTGQGDNLMVVFLIIGICGSILGQTGDLAASAIKRNHGIKDYGNLIPGHGGIMDRFDSVIFTAPMIYYLSFLLLGRL